MALDVISFVIRWPTFGISRNRSIGQPVSVRKLDRSVESRRKKLTGKAQRLADEYEKVSRTKGSLKQAQAVLDRLHGELSGERVVRTSLRQYLDDWFDAKKAETAPSTMTFYRGSLAKVFAVSRQGQSSSNVRVKA
jgi:hypothetical protein